MQDEYLSLRDWTARDLCEGKPGAIPRHLDPIGTRLEIDCENWLNTVANYRTWFHINRDVGRICAGNVEVLARAIASRLHPLVV